jgi:hypothetical protein
LSQLIMGFGGLGNVPRCRSHSRGMTDLGYQRLRAKPEQVSLHSL